MGTGRPEPPRMTLESLLLLQRATLEVAVPGGILTALESIRWHLEQDHKIVISDRRFMWTVEILRARALLDGCSEVLDDHLQFLTSLWWTQVDDMPKIAELARKMTNPIKAQAEVLVKEAQRFDQSARAAIASSGDATTQRKAVQDALSRIKAQVQKAEEILHTNPEWTPAQGEPVRHAIEQMNALRADLTKLLVGA
jgi:MoxR-like ATPase